MKFYHKGTKKSNEPGMASGCLMLIGFGAFIFFLTLLEDVEDLKEYIFEIIIFVVMAGLMVIGFFAKKGKLSSKNVLVKNGYLIIGEVHVEISKFQLDLYQQGKEFNRYHLRDIDGKTSIYSVYQDDLCTYFLENYPEQTAKIQTISAIHDGPYISIKAENRSLSYDLDSGKYTLKIEGQEALSFIPSVYAYDGKYKKGNPLKRRPKLNA